MVDYVFIFQMKILNPNQFMSIYVKLLYLQAFLPPRFSSKCLGPLSPTYQLSRVYFFSNENSNPYPIYVYRSSGHVFFILCLNVSKLVNQSTFGMQGGTIQRVCSLWLDDLSSPVKSTLLWFGHVFFAESN
jgi:hypothetical protein